MIKKAPAQLYVTAKREYWDRNDPNGPPPPMGFLNAYEPGKISFEKKRATQEDWAYCHQYIDGQGNAIFVSGAKLEKRGSFDYPEWWLTGFEYGDYLPNTRTRERIPVNIFVDPQPQVWDNIPMNGFKILKSVSRYSTSNKLWRILDPRGIQFEITTGCLEELMDGTSILKGGIIEEKCVWMSNKNLIVAP